MSRSSSASIWLSAASCSALAPAAVKRHAPGDARQPGPWVPHLRELLAMPQYPHKSLLGGVFRVGAVAQHGVGDPVDEAGVVPHQGFQLVCGRARNRNRLAHQSQSGCPHVLSP